MSPALDATACPICGRPNQCAMALNPPPGVAQAACWCTQVKFSADLLERVPVQARRLACICRDCATAPAAPASGAGGLGSGGG